MPEILELLGPNPQEHKIPVFQFWGQQHRREAEPSVAQQELNAPGMRWLLPTFICQAMATHRSVYEVSSGNHLWTTAGLEHDVRCVAFSPDERTLAVGSGPNIHLWNVAVGQETLVLQEHETDVEGLTFTSDGSALLSVASNPRDSGKIDSRFWKTEK